MPIISPQHCCTMVLEAEIANTITYYYFVVTAPLVNLRLQPLDHCCRWLCWLLVFFAAADAVHCLYRRSSMPFLWHGCCIMVLTVATLAITDAAAAATAVDDYVDCYLFICRCRWCCSCRRCCTLSLSPTIIDVVPIVMVVAFLIICYNDDDDGDRRMLMMVNDYLSWLLIDNT